MKPRRARIVMVGPAPEGKGGISAVVSIWRENDFLTGTKAYYISSAGDVRGVRRLCQLAAALIMFTLSISRGGLIVYVHTAWRNSFLRKSLFLLVAFVLRKKTILHIHPTGFYEGFLDAISGWKKRYVFWALRKVDVFIVLTNEMATLSRRSFPKTPVFVLPNPVDVRKLNTGAPIPREPNQVIYLGWYLQEKGVYDLVDAFTILKKEKVDVSLDFFGTNGEVALSTDVEKKGLSGTVRVNGWLSAPEKIRALRSATLLVLPSYHEGIPNVILEAMATKTPIVSTLVGGLKEILRAQENAVLFRTGDPCDLAEKIRLCLGNDELRQKIAERAYADVVSRFDVLVVKAEFERVMTTILQELDSERIAHNAYSQR